VHDGALRRVDALVAEVERELAALDAVQLGRRVAMQRGRAAAGRDDDLGRDHRAAAAFAVDVQGDLVAADLQALHGDLR
jgi:hypothetical protein